MTAGLNLLVANIFTEHQTRDIKIGTFHTSVRVLTCPTWLCDVLVTPHTVVTTDSEPGAWLAFCCHGTESYGKDPSLKTKQTHQLNEIYKKKRHVWGDELTLRKNSLFSREHCFSAKQSSSKIHQGDFPWQPIRAQALTTECSIKHNFIEPAVLFCLDATEAFWHGINKQFYCPKFFTDLHR